MREKTVAVVVPTCRGFTVPEQSIPVHWYIVHDQEQRPVANIYGANVTHICAPDVEMYGVQSDSIRSAGFLKAALDGHDYIISVDDDCILPIDWAHQHRDALAFGSPIWTNTHPSVSVRGLPNHAQYKPTAISHGLWDGVPDLAGARQKSIGKNIYWRAGDGVWRQIQSPFPQSAMNFGFIKDVAAVMYQPKQGPTTPFDRYADIWGGLFAQRCLSLHGYGFKNGGAIVYHKRASDADVNIIKEAPGIPVHEELCPYVWAFEGKKATLRDTYYALADHVEKFKYRGDYFIQIAKNMRDWAGALNGASCAVVKE